MHAVAAFFLIAILAFPASAADPPPIAGWRYPNAADYTDDWAEFYKGKKEKPFYASADFNGDGELDEAWILISDKPEGYGLFVFLSANTDHVTVIALDHEFGNMGPQGMGISVAEKGVYKTACGKGYWTCGPGESPSISLRWPGINYFMFESARSIFRWADQSRSGPQTRYMFERVWISD